MDILDFIDQSIKVTEQGKPLVLATHQRRVLTLAFRRDPSGESSGILPVQEDFGTAKLHGFR